MMNFSGNLSAVVFRRVLQPFEGEVSLDSRMLRLLVEIDGKRDLRSVAASLGIPAAGIREALVALDRLNLIEADPATLPVLDAAFFDYLTDQLSLALGPMAEILIDDELGDMGLTRERMPTQRAAELVGTLAREIPRDEKRNAFRQRMLKRIKSI